MSEKGDLLCWVTMSHLGLEERKETLLQKAKQFLPRFKPIVLVGNFDLALIMALEVPSTKTHRDKSFFCNTRRWLRRAQGLLPCNVFGH